MPANVEVINDDGTIDCVISIDIVMKDTFKRITPITLRSVPVILFRTGNFDLRNLLEINDQVILFFVNRGIDEWRSTKAKGSMPDEGFWSQKDALAVPVSFANGASSGQSVTFGSGENKVEISADSLKAQFGDNGLEVDSSKAEIHYGETTTVKVDSIGTKLTAGTTSIRLLQNAEIVLQAYDSVNSRYVNRRFGPSGGILRGTARDGGTSPQD